MRLGSTRTVTVAVAFVVATVLAVSQLCLMPACDERMAEARAAVSTCEGVPGHQLHSACPDVRPAAVAATADRGAPTLPDIGLAVVAVAAPVLEPTAEVASVEPPPPDPSLGTSPIRI